MRRILFHGLFLGLSSLFALSCSPSNFTSWQMEKFEETPVTQSTAKMISLRNDGSSGVQTLLGIGFDGTGDGKQHFHIDKVMVGTRVVGLKNIVVPPSSSVNVQITYEPRDLKTTKADFGGWVTGGEDSKSEASPQVFHRAVLLAVYESPKGGIAQIELVGKALPGPNGEISLPEAGVGPCEVQEGVACFTGKFSIDIPKLFTTGPREEALAGPIRFYIAGSMASLRMEDIPPIILVLEGNGPGEPLEGQPVSAVSIVIRGVPGVEAQGSFDGSRMELQGFSFRVQVVVGVLNPEQVANISPIVDFTLEKLAMTTEEPYTNGPITLRVDTTLSSKPSGNPIFDEFLGEAQVIVRFKGNLGL